MQVYPNPFNQTIYLQLELNTMTDVKIEWRDLSGKLIETNAFASQAPGKHEYVFNEKSHWLGGTYLMNVTAE
jgi:hypothetical protein